MKRLKLLGFSFLFLVVIFPSCAPYKMKAIRAQRDHRSDLAVQFALKHLNSHPNDKSVIQILNNAARQYYQDLQKKIQHFERLDDWDKVVSLAEQGYRNLTDVTKIVGTDFPSKDELSYLQSKSQQSKFNRANELYGEAMQLSRDRDDREALRKFKEIDGYIRHFKDTDQHIAELNQKLASQQYQQARDLVNQGKLEDALKKFEATEQYVPDFLDARFQMNQVKNQLADKYFNDGQRLFKDGDYRSAYRELKKTLSYKPDHSSAKNLYVKAKNKLTARLAVFPFSASKLDQKFGGIVSNQILSQAIPRKSDFIMFLDRENLQKIFEEQALSQTGAIDEKTAVEVGKLSGVNTIVVGTVTLISDKKSKPSRRTLTGYFNKRYRDPKGVQRTKKEPFNYIAYEVSRAVEVNLNYRLINVETGAIISNESISERATDSAEWITCPKQFVEHLSFSERKKMKASRVTKAKDSLISQAIESLAKQAATKIISQVSPF